VELLGRIFGPLANFISEVLEFFHTMGAPWWLSVALLTVLVRGVLSPLTIGQARNMRAMQELKPEMDSIRTRHRDDRRKQQEALAELYRERKLNPLAGFVPLLVQIPVFITMYRVIRIHEETFSSFASGVLLWFTDLTRADPYFILPVLSASLLVASEELSTRNTDPSQRRMMRLLPVMFTFFIARFPAGLFVYWITSNTFTLTQNYLIYRRRLLSKGEGEAATEAVTEEAPAKSRRRKPGRRSLIVAKRERRGAREATPCERARLPRCHITKRLEERWAF
jgi:YidC/Oxa1 family membrane protein insertase